MCDEANREARSSGGTACGVSSRRGVRLVRARPPDSAGVGVVAVIGACLLGSATPAAAATVSRLTGSDTAREGHSLTPAKPPADAHI